jgi:carotenoid cleavage dioxygenase
MGAVEKAVRETIGRGLSMVAQYNRARAANMDGDHPYLTGIHAPMEAELTLEALPVEGRIPEGLEGRYLRIGPNPLGRPNPARYHWFTGDGMVHGVRLSGGRAAWYRNRWVRTSRVSAGLGEAPAPGPRLADIAVNTNVIGHAGAIWALVEAGATPVRLDGELATLAHDGFGGTLAGAFSAHPHRDPATGELHAVCYRALDLTQVHHVVVGADGRVRREEPVAVAHGPSIHDCALTERFVLVFDLPVTFSMSAMVAGYEFPYRWNPEHKARVGLLAREGRGADIIWCDVEPCYVYHPCNAYDLRGPDAEVIRFERWTIDPAARQVARGVIDDIALEFPRMDERRYGKAYRYAYSLCVPAGSANAIGDTRIVKHDVTTGARTLHDFGAGRFPGEFVFIARTADAAEDDGFLMGLVVDMNDETTRLEILDARDFAGAPVASVLLPHRIPPGFHGNWVAD